MTGSISFYDKDKMEGNPAAEWKNLDTERFFYGGKGQTDTPSGTVAVGSVYKSVKNESGYILLMITTKEKGGVVVITGSSEKMDTQGASYFLVLPNTTCSSTGQNWAIGLGVVLGVVIIVIVALFMSGVIVFHEGTGAGFGYHNQR